VIRYLRRLEQVLIESLAMLGLAAQRRTGLTGVWLGQDKIASIGIGFRRWVSLHGFALNVATDLSFFDAIVPCGIPGCRMTSIAAQGLGAVSSESFSQIVEQEFAAVFGYQRISTLSEPQLSALLDPAVHACEARNARQSGAEPSTLVKRSETSKRVREVRQQEGVYDARIKSDGNENGTKAS
jgi:hypothetical protein